MRGVNYGRDSVETVVAAANAMALAETRVHLHPAFVPRRRWKSWLHIFSCFKSQNHQNRISKSVLVPEPTETSFSPTITNSNQSSGLIVAPPSSPSSFLQSDPPSTIQSPAKFFSLSSLTSNSYSPPTSSIFAVGPYADDTKLVSPPVFSTFTTEPSTAPFTPPELMQQTTPSSSPEVPFARLFSSSFDASQQSANNLTVGDLGRKCRIFNGRIGRDNGSILDGRIAAVQASVDESRSMVEIEDMFFEFTGQERDQLSEKTSHLLEIEASREFKFNVEAENESDEEMGILSSGSTWTKLKFGFAERNH